MSRRFFSCIARGCGRWLRLLPVVILACLVVSAPSAAQQDGSGSVAAGSSATVSGDSGVAGVESVRTVVDGDTASGRQRGLAATLPQDLSPWGMYLDADPVVKVVLIGLVIASIVNWTVLFAKTFGLGVVRRRQRLMLDAVTEARTLAEAHEHIQYKKGARLAAPELIAAAADEMRLSADALDDREGLKERIAARLERIEATIGRRVNHGTGLLATIGSTAPFVGLFGTVWGIMNSFIGISQAHTTNLAVIAPGIAAALLATALGLVAAIPAVIIYNHFARRIAGYKALVADTSAAVLGLVSRDLSRGVAGTTHLYRVVE